MKTKCIIIDNEPLARDLLKNHIQKLENFEVVAECGDAIKSLKILRKTQVDLIFIDIQMPQVSGIEFLRTLKNAPRVIITTAYREFAFEAFELDVVDYLLKPLNFERFLKAINKYYQLHRDDINLHGENGMNDGLGELFTYLKENKKVHKVFLKDINYIEGLSEYIQIYTNRRKIVTKTSLITMEDKLPDQHFLRIHKSYIVSIPKIEAFTASTVEIAGKELPIGRSFKNTVMNALNFTGTISSI